MVKLLLIVFVLYYCQTCAKMCNYLKYSLIHDLLLGQCVNFLDNDCLIFLQPLKGWWQMHADIAKEQ